MRFDFYTSVFNIDYLHPIGDDDSYSRSEDDALYIGVGPMSGMRFGLGVGGVLNEHVTLGARVILGVAVSQPDIDGAGEIDLAYGLLPYFNYAFGHKRVRPFIEAALGIVGNAGDSLGDTVSFAVALGPGMRILVS